MNWKLVGPWLLALPVAAVLTRASQTCEAPVLLAAGLLAVGTGGIVAGTLVRDWRGGAAAVLGVVVLTVVPMARWIAEPGIPWTHDGSIHAWTIWATAKAMASGDLFPRWLEHIGLGLPSLQFYPPIPVLFGALLLLAGLATPTAMGVIGWSAGALGCVGVAAVLLDRGLGRTATALGAAAYLLAPYRLLDLNYRFALGEMFGLALLLPFLHLACRVANRSDGMLIRRPAVWLWAVASLLLLCHPLSALTGAWALVPLLGIALLRLHRAGMALGPGLKQLLAVGLLVAGTTAFHTVPMVLEQGETRIPTVVPHSPRTYRAKAPTLTQTITRGRWDGRRTSYSPWEEARLRVAGEPTDEVPFYIGLALVAALPWTLLRTARRQQDDGDLLPWAATAVWCWASALGGPALAMGTLQLFYPLQFPWRFLGPASLAALPVLAGWIAPRLTGANDSRSARGLAAVASAALLTALAWDAWPGLGAPSWMAWSPANAAVERMVSIRPPPTCGVSSRLGFTSALVDLGRLLSPDDHLRAIASVPPHGGDPAPGRPAEHGAPWIGRPSGVLPVRLIGLMMPPTSLEPDLASVSPTPRDFWTAETVKRYRNPIDLRQRAALEKAGVTLALSGVAPTTAHAVTSWPRVRLVTEQRTVALAAIVRRPGASYIELALPPGHPGGIVVFVEQAFPGWQSSVDGAGWTAALQHEGLLATHVAAGASSLRFRYSASTAPRRAGQLFSLLAIVWAFWWARRAHGLSR